jgi:C1A family cysteine protease
MPKTRRLGRAGYGWIRDIPDPRDFRYAAVRPSSLVPPVSVDLLSLCSPIVDQEDLGSCTANALASALSILMHKDIGHSVDFSRLYIYWNEREMEGTIHDDAGAMIRDGVKSLVARGACFEINWPYDVSKFTVQPEFGCYTQGAQFRVTAYHRLDNSDLSDLLTCLAEGFPFVGGITIFDSFESNAVAKTGIIPMPKSHESNLGGHAVCFTGYDQRTRRFRVRNSWGTEWGDKGYFEIPFDYITNPDLADDFWTLRAGSHI